MNSIFNDVLAARLVVPGQVYVLCESQPDSMIQVTPIEELFVIKSDADILIALDKIYYQMFAEDYELVKFLGIHKINDDCHEFKILWCDKKFGGNTVHSQYLNRIRTFEEFVSEMDRDFGNGN